VFFNIPVGAVLVRLFDPNSYGSTALGFRTFGPIGRFDHQRAAYPTRADDPDRGILYGAFTLSSCLVEIFGDQKVIEAGTWKVAILTTTKHLNLLDLRGPGAMRAGTVSAIAKESNRRFSQQWSRYFYEHTYVYTKVAGIAFYNAHNDEDALAFYERAASCFECDIDDVRSLRDDSLRPALQDIAATNGMVVTPY
jgi:hypothetical protein